MGKKALIYFMLLFSCGNPGKKPKASEDLKAWLETKLSNYTEYVKEAQDEFGFIDSEHCDSLLFSGLTSINPDIYIDIEAAKDEQGRWHRRPTVNPCYPEGSKSTISRDMFVGLLWHIWRNKRLDLAEEIFQYGKDHDWIMGEGVISRTYFSPGLQATLAEIIYRLGGQNHLAYRSIPQITGKNTGFAAHLDVLHILLRAELEKSISDGDLDLLKHHAERSPNNALFQYAYHKYTDGNMDSAIVPLLKEQWFPADRLPTRGDRKESWLWQRDQSEDWNPATDNPSKKHHGGDLIFVAYLILSDF